MENTLSTKVVIAICVVIAVIAFIGGYYLKGSNTDEEEALQSASPTPSVSTSPAATAAYVPRSYTVKLTSSGLSPALLSIRKGDTVTLLNTTDSVFWPASNPHPGHTDCPGFDAMRGLNNGESYTLTFSKVQTCGYHNHLDSANATMRGTITVR
ncbi:MAG: hypothetical protein AAB375_01895 [Patescibacteria group bacterium]